jgi:hypothetical protein
LEHGIRAIIPAAERAWDCVVSPLRLAGRILTPPESHGDAQAEDRAVESRGQPDAPNPS